MRSDHRLLLGETVQGSKPPHEVDTVDTDHLPIRKQSGQNGKRDTIVRIVESGDQNHTIADVEVCIAGWEALSIKDQGLGHRQENHLERIAVLIRHGLEQLNIFT